MHKVRVVVEIEVPDDKFFTEYKLVWTLKYLLPKLLSIEYLYGGGTGERKVQIKQFSRVIEYRDRLLKRSKT